MSAMHREHRLLSLAFDGNTAERLHREMGGTSPERPDTQQAERGVDRPQVDQLLADVEKRIEDKGKRLQELPGAFHDNFQRHIAEYLVMSVPRFDQNRNRVIEMSRDPGAQSEFFRYRSEMLQGIDKIIDPLLGIEDRAAMDAERRKREAETKRRTLDDQMRALEEEMRKQDPEKLEKPAEYALSNPQEIEQYMKEYDERAQAVHSYGNKMAQIHREVMLLPEKWQEYLKPTANEAAAAGGAVAAGAAIGSFIPGVGTLIGAGIGALVYMGARAAQAASVREEQQRKADEVNRRIAAVRTQFGEAQKKLADVHGDMEADGSALRAAPETLRKQDMQILSERRDEIRRRREEVAAGAEQGRQAAIETEQRDMEIGRHREQLRKAEAELKERMTKTGSAQQDLQTRSATIESRGDALSARRAELEAVLQNAATGSEEQVKAASALMQLEQGEEKMEEARTATEEGERKLSEQRVKMEGGRRATEEGRRVLDEQRIKTAAATENIREFLGTLDAENTGLLEAEQSIGQFEAERNAELDLRTEQVAEGVTAGLLGNHLTIGTMNQQREEVDGLPTIEPQSTLEIVWSHTFEAVGQAWSSIWKGLGGGIQSVFGENTVTNFIAGLSEAVGAFGEGMMHMLAHPVDALKGIVAMVNVFDWEGFKNTYAGLWDFLMAREDFEATERGEEGASAEKSWGKTVGNFALFLIPGYGAVGNGARTAATAFRAARVARGGAVNLAKASMAAAVQFGVHGVGGFGVRIAKMPVDMLRGLAHLPMGIAKAGTGFLRRGATAAELAEAANALRAEGVGGPRLRALERRITEASALEEVQAARSGRASARRGTEREGPEVLAAAEQNLTFAERNLDRVRLENRMNLIEEQIGGMRVNGRSVAEVAEAQGGVGPLATLSDAGLCEVFHVSPMNPFAVNKIVQLRQQLTAYRTCEAQIGTTLSFRHVAGRGGADDAGVFERIPQSRRSAETVRPSGGGLDFSRTLRAERPTAGSVDALYANFRRNRDALQAPRNRRIPEQHAARAEQILRETRNFCNEAVARGLFANSNEARAYLMQRITGRELSPSVTDALLGVHQMPGSGTLGRGFTRETMRAKYRAARDVLEAEYRRQGMPEAQARRLAHRHANELIREGVLGEAATFERASVSAAETIVSRNTRVNTPVAPPPPPPPRMGILERGRNRAPAMTPSASLAPPPRRTVPARQIRVWRNKYERMRASAVDAEAARLRAALRRNPRDEALIAELKQAEITRALDRASVEYDVGRNTFNRDPALEGQPVHVDRTGWVESRLGITRAADAGWECIGTSADGVVVGKWNRRMGRFDEIKALETPPDFLRSMRRWRSLRECTPEQLIRIRRNLRNRAPEDMAPRHRELLDEIDAEVVHRRWTDDREFIRLDNEANAAEAAARPVQPVNPGMRPFYRSGREAAMAYRLCRAGGEPLRLVWLGDYYIGVPTWLGGNYLRAAGSYVKTLVLESTQLPRLLRRRRFRNIEARFEADIKRAALLRASGDESGAVRVEQAAAATRDATRARLRQRWAVRREMLGRSRPRAAEPQAAPPEPAAPVGTVAETTQPQTVPLAPSGGTFDVGFHTPSQSPPAATPPLATPVPSVPAARPAPPVASTAASPARAAGASPPTAPQFTLPSNGVPLLGNQRFLLAIQQRMKNGQPLAINLGGVSTNVIPVRFTRVNGRPGMVVRRGPAGSPEQTISLEGVKVIPPRAPTPRPTVQPQAGPSPTPARPAGSDRITAAIRRRIPRPGQALTPENTMYIQTPGGRVAVIPTAINDAGTHVTFLVRNPRTNALYERTIPIDTIRTVPRARSAPPSPQGASSVTMPPPSIELPAAPVISSTAPAASAQSVPTAPPQSLPFAIPIEPQPATARPAAQASPSVETPAQRPPSPRRRTPNVRRQRSERPARRTEETATPVRETNAERPGVAPEESMTNSQIAEFLELDADAPVGAPIRASAGEEIPVTIDADALPFVFDADEAAAASGAASAPANTILVRNRNAPRPQQNLSPVAETIAPSAGTFVESPLHESLLRVAPENLRTLEVDLRNRLADPNIPKHEIGLVENHYRSVLRDITNEEYLGNGAPARELEATLARLRAERGGSSSHAWDARLAARMENLRPIREGAPQVSLPNRPPHEAWDAVAFNSSTNNVRVGRWNGNEYITADLPAAPIFDANTPIREFLRERGYERDLDPGRAR